MQQQHYRKIYLQDMIQIKMNYSVKAEVRDNKKCVLKFDNVEKNCSLKVKVFPPNSFSKDINSIQLTKQTTLQQVLEIQPNAQQKINIYLKGESKPRIITIRNDIRSSHDFTPPQTSVNESKATFVERLESLGPSKMCELIKHLLLLGGILFAGLVLKQYVIKP